MDFEFQNKKLELLYNSGKSSKYRIEKQVLQGFFEVIAILEAAKDIYDLWRQPSLNFKNYKQWYSVRVNKKWRLEIDIEWENKEKTVGLIKIKELNNHYGD
ncbi:MAG: type II toxin-antitoxin system RelE/ParE family toxin [Spirochaetia bacterium]|nr:type II toxin-antitoxin system RelE/ParE family toxin [Spirochaetia bacterium]